MSEFATAGLNTLMGLATVFAILILISVIIYFFRFIQPAQERIEKARARRRQKKNGFRTEERVEETMDRPPLHAEPFEDAVQPAGVSSEEDEVLAAVITAAIAASSNGAVSADKLVVRSIRRVGRVRQGR